MKNSGEASRIFRLLHEKYRAGSNEVCNGGVACSLLKLAADKPRPLLQNSLAGRVNKLSNISKRACPLLVGKNENRFIVK